MKKRVMGAAIFVTILFIISPSVYAAEPHEDPDIAESVFSGISLLRYYSGSLDFVLSKDPAEVETRLEKMPFANIPQSLEEARDSFAASTVGISHLVVEIYENLGKLRALVQQFRLEETIETINQTKAKLSQANSELEQIEQATEITDKELKASLAPEGSELRQSYDVVIDRINRIREMLALYEDLLEELLKLTDASIVQALKPTDASILQPLKPTDASILQPLKPTDITLQIEPMAAFVGDNIRFEGVLTSGKKPLAGRQVDILVNSSRYVTAKTDAYGHYQGMLQVPYWYVPELDLQALYYPQDKDIGLYLASLSPVIKLKVLFYKAELEITVEDKAYPGLETTVAGKFDYGESPPLKERKAEIYFDDVLVAEATAPEVFAQEIKIDPEAEVGEHVVTVSAPAAERYSSVDASVMLNVTRATPFLDLNIPGIAMIPGSVALEGRLYSEVGPVSEALIEIGLGKSQFELTSSEDGTFDTKINTRMGLGMIGSQDLVIRVLPQEPWHTPLVTTRTMLMVNMVNCAGILAILIFLGIYLPRRFRGRLGVYARRATRPAIAAAPPELAPVYSEWVTVPTATEESEETSGEPRNRIFYWYRLVVRLIQGITKALSKPQQTLREFAYESSKVLGPAGKYFIELTEMVERLLYSQYKPTKNDVGRSEQLSHNIEGAVTEEELEGEGV